MTSLTPMPTESPPPPSSTRALMHRSWAVAWPMTLIMLFEFAIAFTDVWIAGRIGKEVQAAYGLVTQIYFIFTILGNAFTAGTVSVVSRLAADQHAPDYRRALATAIAGTLGAGLALGLAGILLSPFIIRLMEVPAEIKPFAAPLVSIFAAGLVFHYILINTNGLLRASGRVRESLATMALTCAVNIGLNLVLSFRTPLGFRGIALSTAAAVTLGAVVNLARFRSSLRGGLNVAGGLLGKMVSVGWPIGLLQVLWQLASMVLFLLLSQLPERRVEVLAAFTNGLRIEALVFLPAFAFNMANAVIVGNFLGRKEDDHAYRGGMATAGLGVAVVTVMTGLVLLNARAIAGLVTPNAVVAEETVRYLYIAFLSEPLMAWGVILSGGLSGAGDTRATMLRIAGAVWLVRIPAAWFFGIVLGFGAPAVWWAMNASQLVQAVLLTRRYMGRRWIRPV